MIEKHTLYVVRSEVGSFLKWKDTKDIHWCWNFVDADFIYSKDFAKGLAAAQPSIDCAHIATVDVIMQA